MSQITVNKIQGLTTGGNANTIVLNTDSADRVTVDSIGRVGINTTSHYDNSTKITAAGRINTSNGTVTGSMNYGNGTVVNIGAMTNHPVQIMSNNQTILVVDTSGLSFDDGSNYLDDYEEGTFTPAFVGSTSSDFTYLARSGSYTKIGSLVNLNMYLRLTSKGTSSGGIYLTDFPFTVADTLSSTAIEANGICGYVSGFATTLYGTITALAHTGSGGGNGAEMYFNNAAAGNSTLLSDTHISDTFNIRVSVTYRTS